MASSPDHTQFFARIHLYGLIKTIDGEPSPITLERTLSFPSPVSVRGSPGTTCIDADLSPRSLDPAWELEARICFDRREGVDGKAQGALGHGRAGLVYPLEISSIRCARTRSLVSPGSVSLPALCIKLAIPGYARNLAREAWFYEHFDQNGLSGVVTPRCYGVFHVSLEGQYSKIDIPGYDYYSVAQKVIHEHLPVHTAPMVEEDFDANTKTFLLNKYFLDDTKGSYGSSPWMPFRESPTSTTLTVLVMDQLGEMMTMADFEKDLETEIQPIYEHLRPVFIMHGDGRFPNVLRVPPSRQVLCSQHNCSHQWNLVDWENAILHFESAQSRGVLRSQWFHLVDFFVSIGGVYQTKPKSK